MKTPLLLLGISLGLTATAQTLNESDTLSTGDSQAYFVLDSSATAYDAVTGAGVTWDYSAIGGYGIAANNNDVIDASASAFASSYPTASYSEDFENSVKSFFTNDEANDQVITHGFVFQQGAETFIIKYDDDQLVSLKFPMNQGDTYTDDIEGTASAPFGGSTVDADITGSATITADGSGTLIIGTNTVNDVLRVHTSESASGIVFGTTATVTRNTYIYYDVASGNMPIFMHAQVGAEFGGTTYGFTAVYSKFDISPSAGIEDFQLLDLSIYPNPVNGNFTTVNTEEGTDKLTILNSLGAEVMTINNPSTSETIDVSDLTTGVYFVQANKGTAIRTEKFIVK